MNRFSACLAALERVARGLNSPLAVVGGLAAIHHQALVTTLDVDVAVARADRDRFVEEAVRHGFRLQSRSAAGWHRLVFEHPEGDVPLHVVPEGENSPRDPPHAPANPSPQALGVVEGLGYAAFAPWVMTKLVANRDKDRYHLVEALKAASQAQVACAVQLLRPLHSSYMAEFERLVKAAEEESSQARW